eukprot:CAMPEP_0197037692 /NCGR_PEP_ID=MMETSP1384-20130603/14839_1 /TAXON_ID=29189 /ORGANISM="Ammonia sp." /LENGTH=297 /DNA_ID=CAMNT_0042468035 /DNA_START=9 /DNA_END=902 /DNA_ORIENTATION=+
MQPGKLFRQAVQQNKPLQCLGAVNAYSALLAKRAGAQSLYLSGSGVATASYGLPDLGITNLNDVCIDINRITSRVPEIPLLVDIDTGFGNALSIKRTIEGLIKNGAAACHIEDQEDGNKRCGHRPNKSIVDMNEMLDRLRIATKTAKESHIDSEFVVMARTDAYANEGFDGLLKRCEQYVSVGGADMLFPEALTDLESYYKLNQALGGEVPILANITEFGKTPLFTKQELYESGVRIVLYPLSAHRAMAKAALTVYESIVQNGHQKDVVGLMQTRDDLYKTLDYHEYEELMDNLYGK